MFTLLNKYPKITLLCAGLLIGFYMCVLFNGCGPRPVIAKSGDIQKVAEEKKQQAITEASYQERIDSLGTVSKHLKDDLQATQTALNRAKAKNAVLQTQIYALLDKPVGGMPSDTATRLADCDSLNARVRDLVVGDSTKDSLYDQVTADLQEQVLVKDSTLQVQRAEYQSLKVAFDQSLANDKALQDQTRALTKMLQRQKFKATAKTVGLMIAAALVAHLFTR
ncbi:hypothetical protein [Dinghuibacter silviterrae]|uniref:Uncharacterized protein n=1 Tax=Dinghuibacter silviterrae TaxID=1539049 RepID=A0A4R8DW97_9BACT|nr:hypothetical protein [Dinghuibacter silviterrae]TDX01491.1 hypothetical protein EDB95_2527 [Dinghuibacter silviterrae]